MSRRPTFEEFKKKALAKREVKEEYDATAVVYELRRKLIELRKKAWPKRN